MMCIVYLKKKLIFELSKCPGYKEGGNVPRFEKSWLTSDLDVFFKQQRLKYDQVKGNIFIAS